jgi:hypothetical protein
MFAVVVVLVLTITIVLVCFKLRKVFADKSACDNACYPANVYQVLGDGDLCLCGPYTNTGKPKYEVRVLDGGSL